jgi:hypothetical protein
MYFLRVLICSIFASILVFFLLSKCDIEIKDKETIKIIFLGCLFLSWCVVSIVDIFKTTPEEKEPVEIEPKKKKKKKKKEDEIISVTEIKGERNIIIDVVVKIIVFIIGLVLTGFFTSLCGGIIGLLPLIFAIMYCFKTNDKNKD